MKKGVLVSLLAIVPLFILSGCESMVVFDPQGPVARSITDLINWSILLMAFVCLVVFALFGYIVWKYRATKENADYEPDEHGSTKLEIVWTVIPFLIIIALTIPTVKTIYALEDVPKDYKDHDPIVINVTSADWKWIFSYPEEGIETVNYVNIPAGVPIEFKLTSAGTMQSFWIPALAGQKYTMYGAETDLYVVADNPGNYEGQNTSFNGKGYAEMKFDVEAKTLEDYDKWVDEVKENAPELTEEKYKEIIKPTHLGRLTFSNTHLEWIDHGKGGDSNYYLNPELYRVHGYPGRTFEKNQESDGGEKDAH
ncbi:cytochrome aa3 quinol oxidase subunit II [Cytobacillus oceanisediminis]|jgi:cytochrome aa3-600 menaquinol oxidase subunit 2|uniref:Quinol oxidase subunit 2 n=1 Tax=Niallia alba TaxID=2729105 RepID=A0A7Y0PKN1_9BACI|nr:MULTISPECIES: cytochrome aa3 quinol oxidase subunit II [Bacillaceae]EOR26067.1 cytochrome aa3 quinol oxidase subunit II [Niallia nealsonii AAU1]MBZ9534950.1 cytochrome aa3 quinol oxidase subunit II [Cytobacillus oceanisediminis]NMO75860.1 cytochrome aa3 quinol oxidase subunit II [Niallia alba]UTI43658.1 cytochrome aa3 quinol oxidase subunit II [Niallia sp. RD1]